MKTKSIMKKAIAFVLGITMVFGGLMLPDTVIKEGYTAVSAFEDEVGGCKYTFSLSYNEDDGYKAVIEKVEYSGDTLEIPSHLNRGPSSFPVKQINDDFLKDDQNIKTVIFPDTIKYIGNNVLKGSSVENITLPEGLEHIGDYFASDCTGLKTLKCDKVNIGYEDMGDHILYGSELSGIMNEQGAVCLGNWLVQYVPGSTSSVKFADLGNNDVKIEYVGSNIFKYLTSIRSIDLEGIKYLGKNTLSYCAGLKTIENDDSVEKLGEYDLKGIRWFDDSKEKGMARVGNTLFYYRTDGNMLDLTSGELAGIRYVGRASLQDCKELDTVICSSNSEFGMDCFYVANELHTEEGNMIQDPFPENPVYNIKNVYLDGKKVTYHLLLEDAKTGEWLKRNIDQFENSAFSEALITEKMKELFDQLDITYYGIDNDMIGTYTPAEEFYIRLKVFNYISIYDYDHGGKYGGLTGAFLLGGKLACDSYASLIHYMLECAGVRARTFYTDPTDPSVLGVHFWNGTKIGDEWFENDDGWSAQNNKHNYSWFLMSSSGIATNYDHEFQMSYDSLHFYSDSKSTEHEIAERLAGDIDGNDKRDKADSSTLWLYLKGDISSIDEKAADINFDGEIDVTDAVLLEQFVNGTAIDKDNIPTDGLAPSVHVAFLNGKDYDDIQYVWTERGGYITLPELDFEAPEGKKLSYDIGMVGQKVRITQPLTVVNVKWIDADTPDYSEPESSVPDASVPDTGSENDSSSSDSNPDDSSRPGKVKDSLGDVNNDGTIDIEDAVMVINHVNGQKALTTDEEKRADIDKNSDIDIEDAVAIISHVNGVNPIE